MRPGAPADRVADALVAGALLRIASLRDELAPYSSRPRTPTRAGRRSPVVARGACRRPGVVPHHNLTVAADPCRCCRTRTAPWS
jgi:hypothetical protein